MTEQKIFRCAVYTRKSSEEGLEQDFNSLEAQREACGAYIKSQSHEGWKLVPAHFDDGGFSGGNMARPGLGQLMQAVRDGQVDVIVIYKIDRLTRSLTDFARLAETFDKHGVSFVSVTQQFNTTTSMGRLMLNVLLSFAQFEREITGERIRDKIAASKKKGMWMGGPVPIGYEVKDRKLIIAEAEATIVRSIFRLYLEEGNVPMLLERLEQEGIKTAERVSGKGGTSGGRRFTRGHLYKLLSNPIYFGRIPHKAMSHPGQHEALIDAKTWAAVQAKLAGNTQGERTRRRRANKPAAMLADILFSDRGNRMVPSHATKSGRRYAYYVEQLGSALSIAGSQSDGARWEIDAAADGSEIEPFTGANRQAAIRLPAQEVEAALVIALRDLLMNEQQLLTHLGDVATNEVGRALARGVELAGKFATADLAARLVNKIVVRRNALSVWVDAPELRHLLGVTCPNETDPAIPEIVVDAAMSFRKRGRQLKLAMGGAQSAATNVDPTLVTVVARAHDWFDRLARGSAKSIAELAAADGFDAGYVSHVLPLAFLAPDRAEEILAGKQPVELTADRLIWHTEIPTRW